MANIAILQVLLILIVGLWIAAKFKDSPIINFFGRNDWFVGAFFIIAGYTNYLVYSLTYVKNLNLLLVVIGTILVILSIVDISKKN